MSLPFSGFMCSQGKLKWHFLLRAEPLHTGKSGFFHVVTMSRPPAERAGSRGHRDPGLLPWDMSWSQLGLFKACLWPLKGRKCR
ncbi:uncharacterized [Tachysurus ichikawai]